MKNKKIFFTSLVLIVVIILLTIVVCSLLLFYFTRTPELKTGSEYRYHLVDLDSEVSNIVYDLYGHVTNKENNYITIESLGNAEEPIIRKAVITPKTKFVLFHIILFSNSDIPPEVKEKELSFSDIKKGDEVILLSRKDPESNTEIEALEIKLIEKEYRD